MKAEARAGAKAVRRQEKAEAKAAKRGGTTHLAAGAQPAGAQATGVGRRPATKPGARGPARQTRWTRLVGLAFCIAGFGAIGVGWAGVASKDYVQGQLPYLVSGGAAGLGLIVFGVGMMVMAQLRTEGRRLLERLDEWRRLPAFSGAEQGASALPATDGAVVTLPAPEPGAASEPTTRPTPMGQPGAERAPLGSGESGPPNERAEPAATPAMARTEPSESLSA